MKLTDNHVKAYLLLMALSGIDLGLGYFDLVSTKPFASGVSQAIYGISEMVFGIGLIVAYIALLCVASISGGRGYKHESDPGLAVGLVFLIVPLVGLGMAWEGFELIQSLVV